MREFVRYTPKELEEARQTDMVYFLERQNGYTFKTEGGTYRCNEHSSLVIGRDRKRWYWNSKNIGGNNVLDWLQSIESLDFQAACRVVITKESYYKNNFELADKPPPIEKKPLQPPLPTRERYSAVYAYLTKTRGISPEVVQWCFKSKLLYQDEHRNAVFVGRDENDSIRFCEIRGTNTAHRFRQNVSGSEKGYSFHIDATRKTDTVFVFEAPIDLLAHCSLSNIRARLVGIKNWQETFLKFNRLSLSGTSDVALEAYLGRHGEITKIALCLDGDEAGRTAAEKIAKKYTERGYTVCSIPPRKGKDYDEYIQAVRQNQQQQSLSQPYVQRIAQGRGR